MDLILTFDLGTTSVKTCIFGAELGILGSSTLEYQLETPAPGIVELPSRVYWGTVRQGIREAADICVKFDGETFYAHTGVPECTGYCPVSKLLWFRRNQPEVYEKAYKFLLLEDFIIQRLTGRFVTEKSLLCTTGYYDIMADDYWQEMLDAMGLDREKLPQALECGTVAGTVLPEIAWELGLSEETVVMKNPIRDYIGKPEQLFSVREGRFSGGKADGVRFIEVDNGTGLHVTLLPDRCLDIYQVRLGGRSFNYLTANGITAPAYYNPFGEGWSDGFFGGFLFTCGLTNIGLKGDEGWETEKEHGCISNSPARHVNLTYGEDGMSVAISGTMHEGILGGANLLLTRTVELSYGENTIRVTDTVKNQGCRPSPMMLLYHCNTGYPLLSEEAVVDIPHQGEVRGRTPHAAAHLDTWQQIDPPQGDHGAGISLRLTRRVTIFDLLEGINTIPGVIAAEEL